MSRSSFPNYVRELRWRLQNARNPYPIVEDMFEGLHDQQGKINASAARILGQTVQIHQLERALDEKQRQLDRMGHTKEREFCYVSVLVDGTCMHFLNELLWKGFDGGNQAVYLLARETLKYLRAKDPSLDNETTCRILVCANEDELQPLYGASLLTAFIRGFNSNRLANFVDVGGGHEKVEDKLHTVLRHDYNNKHCRHVVFCGSGNDKHAGILFRFRGDPAITLVEGKFFPPGMRVVANIFDTTKFNDVFMTPVPQTSNEAAALDSVSPDGAPQPSSLNPSHPVKGQSFPLGMRTVAGASDTTKLNNGFMSPVPQTSNEAAPLDSVSPDRAPQPSSLNPYSTVEKVEDHFRVHLNGQDQRVDSIIPHSEKNTLSLLRGRKLCNEFILLGVCQAKETDRCRCIHRDVAWTRQQKLDILYISRLRCCALGFDCRKPKCIRGHRCPFGDKCKKARCAFTAEMHIVDCNIYKTL
ncbi:hypothetical protein BJX68DRAFT_273303 [Aspergillus pseudodeflectus]|uniref:C-x8-C-x5-C-x3-H type zinc finger protein n=1 Tax=Aspergillus pseudodeflectus TaxID=176178 RepID=A0ABR4JA28_9EURO